jgi:plastocyanin domain-containing protein
MVTLVTRGLVFTMLGLIVGAALGACDSSTPAPEKPAPSKVAERGARTIEIAATDRGFSPASIDVVRGEPLLLRFTRTSSGNCLEELVFPDLDVRRELPLNSPVEVALTPEKEGNVLFQCGMGMVRGRLVVKAM